MQPRPIRPLSLTDRQMRLVQSAAASVPVDQRDAFLQSVARRLCAEPSDVAVSIAVNAALDLVPSRLFLEQEGANKA